MRRRSHGSVSFRGCPLAPSDSFPLGPCPCVLGHLLAVGGWITLTGESETELEACSKRAGDGEGMFAGLEPVPLSWSRKLNLIIGSSGERVAGPFAVGMNSRWMER